MAIKILGIETSCDETALSLIEAGRDEGVGAEIQVLADHTLSQVALHRAYGGVFPNLAKREHLKNLPVMLAPLLQEAKLSEESPTLDAIAVTTGPGLEPCLWTGITFAEALGKKWGVPIVAVNHMEGHIFSALLRRKDEFSKPSAYRLAPIALPALALLISGGHTELVLMRDWFRYEVVGETRDDAVGEAFDKAARLLGLPYPGGPEISRLAEEARNDAARTITLPRPMLHSGNLDFSFSGLKTAVRYLIQKLPLLTAEIKREIAREFEDAVTEVLIAKTARALEQYGAQTLILGGGVIANTHIRRSFEHLANTYGRKYLLREDNFLFFPEPSLTTDNALMIAVAGYLHSHTDHEPKTEKLIARGNLRLDENI